MAEPRNMNLPSVAVKRMPPGDIELMRKMEGERIRDIAC
jgi:hypothetical protein